MTVEERLRNALRDTDEYQPSPDLFVKVKRSIDEDRAHRRRVLRIAAGVAAFVAAVAVWVAIWWDPAPGREPLPWWSVVAVVVAVEVAVVAVVGPAIRRFGRSYVDDVFRTNPATGGWFLALLDVAYYLAFSGIILVFIPFEPAPEWLGAGGLALMLQEAVVAVGLLVLAMGLLHALTIFVLPFAGLVFASTRHRMLVHESKGEWAPEVRRAHRTVTIVLIAIGIVIAWQLIGLLIAVLGAVLGSAGG